MSGPSFVGFVTVLSPVVLSAGLAAYVALIVSKKSNETTAKSMKLQVQLEISRYREQWIQRLRDAMAEFQALGTLPDGKPSQSVEFYKLGTKIELLMNPDDPDYQELQQLMYVYLAVSEGGAFDKYTINPKFVQISQRILKREWERLKLDLRQTSDQFLPAKGADEAGVR